MLVVGVRNQLLKDVKHANSKEFGDIPPPPPPGKLGVRRLNLEAFSVVLTVNQILVLLIIILIHA